ncbi:unnamed protein product [Prorocentrum cordatum]|uniref:Uncharacterized protein n=1 Tax=Prorocentrum cordatum TaxID=2364126 RepID=A0ABN9V3W7_9DINO|nr:unnamed protein product [Polarella glacialis]
MARPRGSVHPPATRRAAGGRGDGRGQADRVPCFFFWGGEWTAGARAEERPACPQGALGLLVGLEGVAMDSVAPAPKTHGRPGVSGLGFLRKASCGRAPHRNRPPASTGGAAASPPAAVRAVSAPAAPAPRRGPEREAGPPHLERSSSSSGLNLAERRAHEQDVTGDGHRGEPETIHSALSARTAFLLAWPKVKRFLCSAASRAQAHQALERDALQPPRKHA